MKESKARSRETIQANEIKSYLHHYIGQLQELHDKLSENSDGRPLSAGDKAKLRTALAASWVKDIQAEQAMFFQDGNIEDVINATENLVAMLEVLS